MFELMRTYQAYYYDHEFSRMSYIPIKHKSPTCRIIMSYESFDAKYSHYFTIQSSIQYNSIKYKMFNLYFICLNK